MLYLIKTHNAILAYVFTHIYLVILYLIIHITRVLQLFLRKCNISLKSEMQGVTYEITEYCRSNTSSQKTSFFNSALFRIIFECLNYNLILYLIRIPQV